MSKKVTELVEELAKPIVDSLQLVLEDVEYVKEGAQWYLRVFIDKPDGIDLDDCQAVSEQLEEVLDKLDPIPNSYILEVSSPGIERPLKKPEHFQRFAGSKVLVKTFAPIDGKKEFIGQLQGINDNMVSVEIDGKEMMISLDKIASAKLMVEF
ncbi:ribosome maturation factor RimP [Peptococcaceae bacterium 1198_IL3148]